MNLEGCTAREQKMAFHANANVGDFVQIGIEDEISRAPFTENVQKTESFDKMY